MHINESDLDNVLAGQKDDIIRNLNERQYQVAINKLHVCRHLWKQVAYAYKGREICQRAIAQLNQIEAEGVRLSFVEIFRNFEKNVFAE